MTNKDELILCLEKLINLNNKYENPNIPDSHLKRFDRLEKQIFELKNKILEETEFKKSKHLIF